MKIRLADVSRIYRNHLREEKSAAGAPCPALGRLVQCVMGEMPGKERDEIVRHAANCSACAAALKHVLSLSAETDRAASELAAYRGERKPERSQDRKVSWGRPFMKPTVAVLAGIFVVAVLILSIPRLLDRSGTRGGTEARIVLISPVKAESLKDSLEFRWQSLVGASSYTVEVFDKSFRLLWRSERVTVNEIRPPADISRRLILGETYYWTVAAVTDNRAEIRSRLAEFSVK